MPLYKGIRVITSCVTVLLLLLQPVIDVSKVNASPKLASKQASLSLTFPATTLSANTVSEQDTHDTASLALFTEAQQAIMNGQSDRFDRLYANLINHPLAAYLYRDWLIAELRRTPNKPHLQAQIKQFLDQHFNQVVARRLRHTWLNYLADTGQNKLFLSFYQPQSNSKLKCRHLWLKLKQQGLTIDQATKIEALWLTGKSLPKSCDPLISDWRKMGGLDQPLVWQRMMLAARASNYQLLRYLTQLLSHDARTAGIWLERITRRPARLNESIPKAIPAQMLQDILKLGLNKLAWQDAEATIKQWKRLSTTIELTANETQHLKRSIGLSLAINESNKAEAWLKSLLPMDDDSVQQWLLSTNLVNNDWQDIIQRDNRYLEQNTYNDNWKFWNAIAKKQLGESSQFISQLETLAKKRSYYGFLAASYLAKEPELNHQAQQIPQSQIARLENKLAAKRAKALLKFGRVTEARSEWNQLLQSLPKSELAVAAHLAHQWDWNHQSILAFSRSRQLNDVKKRFPLVKKAHFERIANQRNIPTSWAYAITRQESAFKKDATSSAGAQGLMQLKPSTARLVARAKLKHSKLARLSSRQIARHKLLHKAELNIQLGIAHLEQMLDYYDGNPVLATAAYNAGSGRVDQWLKDNQISDTILWIEQIPYKETRDYVKNVLTYQVIYASFLEGEESFINKIKQMPIPTHHKSNTQISTR